MWKRRFCTLLIVATVFVWSELWSKKTSGSFPTKRIRLKKGVEAGVVQKRLFYKKMRFEFTPLLFGSIINDPFIDTYLFGVGFAAHLVDWFALELQYFYSKTADNDLNRVLQNDYGKEVIAGKTKSIVEAGVLITPLYGKISLTDKFILHIDVYGAAGYGMTRTDLGSKGTFNFGGGQRFFLNRWMALKLDIRNYMHSEERGDITINKNNLIVTMGASIYFPRGKAR